ncbi:sodium/hydrogen exchanger [Anaeromyxobacter sp. K]|uniref:cation:proton antiporter domain-containing protein n=1 Tax=Anaeromyxobacter sp. (strain K) TaxID=447217 RepID=UPI00015F8853|nr:cation:proton antiporter [Anaeromyxobacter sp. K]ACG72843.1 sodium/hydrogen exchanger [Anaeromyxobacter sp. K]
MHGAHTFLLALTVVLGVAAVTTVLFQRLRQPVVLGYILAGLIVGPYVPVPLVADREIVQTLSELGVILLMFALGLEFSLRKLVQVGPTAGVTAVVQSSIMVWLGFVAGRAFGWTVLESVFAGAIVAMSSTTIIAKAFDDLKVRGPLRDLVVGVLLVEDLFAILFMAVLTAVATGAGVSPGELGATLGRLGAFLAVLLGGGMLLVPRAVRYVRRRGSAETLLVASLGLCFGFAWLALAAGYSVALGAFIAGSLVAESGEAHAVEELIRPVRDLFAAIFFVSVGMLIDPALVARHWVAVVVFIGLVVVGKSAAVGLGAFLTGNGVRTSVQTGMSLAQIGEFSFILAALGTSLGATREFLYPVAVAVSAVTTLTTPWLIQASGPAATWIDRKLPSRLQTLLSLYGSWLEQLRSAPDRHTLGTRLRAVIRALLVDAVAVVGITIGASVGAPRATRRIAEALGAGPETARWTLFAAATLLAAPFLVGLVRNGRRLGLALASTALPEGAAGRPDLAAAPRRALLAVVQLAATLAVLLPVLAVTQPFLPGVPGVAVLLAVLGVLGIGFWRSAAELQGHVRAGAQVIVEALARQASGGDAGGAHPPEAEAPGPRDGLERIRAMFPGIGEPTPVRLREGSPGAGHSLSELGVRGRTGATVLAISRAGASVMVPTAAEVLRAGDVLVLAGAHEAVDAARELLGAERFSPAHLDAPEDRVG